MVQYISPSDKNFLPLAREHGIRMRSGSTDGIIYDESTRHVLPSDADFPQYLEAVGEGLEAWVEVPEED